MIADRTLLPGTRLPAERDLARSFAVSRNSVRQALKVLEIMGVVRQKMGSGTYLNEDASSILTEAFRFLVLSPRTSNSERTDDPLVRAETAKLALDGSLTPIDPFVVEARTIIEPDLCTPAASGVSAEAG